MRKTIASILAAAGVISAGLAQAAGADLSVKGKLQAGACNVALGHGGAFDLGSIDPVDLSSDYKTTFDMDGMPVVISCATATRFGLSLQDNRAGSAAGMMESELAYGLGWSGGKKIGEYASALHDAVTAGGVQVDILMRVDGESAWHNAFGGWESWQQRPGFLVSFTRHGDTLPGAFEQIEAKLYANVAIRASSELDLSQQIQIDGSATLELVYL